METVMKKETIASFIHKILNGTAIAIVVALIPNAILASIFKPLAANYQMAADFLHIIQVFQFFTPIMAGFLIAQQFNLTQMQQIAVGGAAYIGSGAWTLANVVLDGNQVSIFQLKGIGDLINMMITAAIAVKLIQLVGNKFGALNIILLPILLGTGAGYVGWLLLPYVSTVTFLIGQGINSFTTLQPVLMSILIAMSFSVLIVSPISTVAIGIAIGLTGLSSASAAMGVASSAAVLVWGTMKTNKAGVPLAIGLGAMKMMMPNIMKTPKLLVPITLTAAISSISVPVFSLVGTPASAGFGLVGLVGPIASLEGGATIVQVAIAWIVIPFVVGYVANYVCMNVLKLYGAEALKFEN